MCGIAGIFKLSSDMTVDDVSAVLEMLDAQFHRGPDDWGLLLPRPSLDEPEIKAQATVILSLLSALHKPIAQGSTRGLQGRRDKPLTLTGSHGL